jgi:hypothetical protein
MFSDEVEIARLKFEEVKEELLTNEFLNAAIVRNYHYIPPQGLTALLFQLIVLNPHLHRDNGDIYDKFDFRSARLILSNPFFIDTLINKNIEEVTELQIILAKSKFSMFYNMKTIENIDRSLCVLLKWVYAVIEYYEAINYSNSCMLK